MPTAPTADGMPSTADHDNELLQVTAKHESLQSPPTSPTSPPTRSPTELPQFGIKLVEAAETELKPSRTTLDETGPVGAIRVPAALLPPQRDSSPQPTSRSVQSASTPMA